MGPLARIASIAGESNYADGETIAGQGEPGDELHIVVEGEVRVLREGPGAEETELARRTVGEVVGEMALITQDPRMASLIDTRSSAEAVLLIARSTRRAIPPPIRARLRAVRVTVFKSMIDPSVFIVF